MEKGFILPSTALTIRPGQVRFCKYIDKPPLPNDVVYGVVTRIGQHPSLENVSGRIHVIHDGSKAIFVLGNRYAPDFYEGLVPTEMMEEVDLLARSGMMGMVKNKNSMINDPARTKVLGWKSVKLAKRKPRFLPSC